MGGEGAGVIEGCVIGEDMGHCPLSVIIPHPPSSHMGQEGGA